MNCQSVPTLQKTLIWQFVNHMTITSNVFQSTFAQQSLFSFLPLFTVNSGRVVWLNALRGQKNADANAFVCGQTGCVSTCVDDDGGHRVLGAAWFGSPVPCVRSVCPPLAVCRGSGSSAGGDEPWQTSVDASRDNSAFGATGVKLSFE